MFYDLGVRAFQRGVLEVAKRFGYAGIAVLLRDEDAEVLLKDAVTSCLLYTSDAADE